MNRLMTQQCQIVQLPATGQTEVTQIATALPCSHPFPINKYNWTEATDFEGLEIFTALKEVNVENHIIVKKGQILTFSGERFTVEAVKKRQCAYGTRGHLQLLLRKRN